MFNVGGPEVLVILLVALIALGPAQLPEAARKVGRAMGEVRKISSNFQREITSAFDAEEQKAKEKPVSAGGPTDVSEPADEDEETG
jgi:sec-independent protein translocase protein TatB